MERDMSTPPLATPPTSQSEQPVKSGRGRKPGSKARERQQLPADAFVMEEIPEEERGQYRRIRVERSEQQQKIDAKVLDTWRKWNEAGQPAKWDDMPIQFWLVPNRYAEDALFYLDKAAKFHGKKLVLGHVDKAKDKPGNTRIPFCVVNRPRKSTP
jgi:hypothetical protein